MAEEAYESVPLGREGTGSAFILPNTTRHSAFDYLALERQRKRQEEMLANKQLQDTIIGLDTLTANALPKHQTELRTNYNDFLNWYAGQRKTGQNPLNPNSESYIELHRRLNDLKNQGALAKLAKDYTIKDLYGEYKTNPDKYENESLTEGVRSIENTPLSQLNNANFPTLRTNFNDTEYLNKYLQRAGKGKTYPKGEGYQPVLDEKGKPITGRFERPYAEGYNSMALGQQMANDNSYEGKRNFNYYMKSFEGLPEEDQLKLTNEVIKENASASKNPDLLKKGIVGKLAAQRIEGLYPSTKGFETVSREAPRVGNGSAAKNNVAFSPLTVPNDDPVMQDVIPRGHDFVRVEQSTPAEGENKPTSFRANNGIAIGPHGERLPVKLTGRSIVGKILSTVSGYDENGKKLMYAEIEGEGLTNKELYPNVDWEVRDKKGRVEKEKPEAIQKPKVIYYVPYRNVAKNQQAEFKKYNNVDAIKELEKHHQVKFTDYIPEDESAGGIEEMDQNISRFSKYKRK